MGAAFTLICVDAPALAASFERAAGQLGIPLEVVHTADCPTVRAWGTRTILMRPDQYVAYAGNDADVNPARVMTTAAGRKTAT